MMTNTSAMVALQTLQGINRDLGSVTKQVSTGLKVATARDNASIWAIASVMRTDVRGFEGISESLATASASIAVARNAAEATVDLLTEMKGKIVAAQSPSADRAKLQTDISELSSQIASVVNSAQFNGLNLVNGTGNMTVLASLDRDAGGAVTAGNIQVNGVDLSSAAGASKATLAGSTGASTAGDRAATTIDDGATADVVVVDDTLAAGDKFKITVGAQTVTYTVTDADVDVGTPQDNVAAGIRNALLGMNIADLDITLANDTLTLENNTGGDLALSVEFTSAGTGGLAGLAGIDVTTDAAGALEDIEGLLQTAINAAAAFGSAQNRVDIQSAFMGKLTDSLKAGIGALVDANLEEASAKLQALQVQQQLGIQALSIANQQPQSVLALFR